MPPTRNQSLFEKETSNYSQAGPPSLGVRATGTPEAHVENGYVLLAILHICGADAPDAASILI